MQRGGRSGCSRQGDIRRPEVSESSENKFSVAGTEGYRVCDAGRENEEEAGEVGRVEVCEGPRKLC